MNSAEVIKVIQALVALIQIARSVGVDIASLAAMQKKAEEEGRELTVQELTLLANEAQEAIDRL